MSEQTPHDSQSVVLPSDLETSPELEPIKPPLLGYSQAALTRWVQQQGQPTYRGKQLHHWLYQRQARSLMEISVFPKAWREQMTQQENAGELDLGRSKIHFRSVAPDGTVKFLLRLKDGHIIRNDTITTIL